jgi:predicted permease
MPSTSRGTSTVPIRTGLDGGMHAVFQAALKPAYTDAAGIVRTPTVSLPGTIPAHARLPGADGPTGSVVEASRAPARVALAPQNQEGSAAGSLFGNLGLALASVAMIAIVPLVNVLSVAVLAHYASPEKRSAGSIVVTVAGNPLIWACAIGLALNVTHVPLPRLWHEVADALGRSSLAIGLLVTGAGLQLEGLFRPSLAASVAVFLKLVLMPVIAVTLALQFGIADSNLAVVTICSAVPTASSAYVLARQMGGDAPLLAQIITLQTILAAVTMPVAIALAAMF